MTRILGFRSLKIALLAAFIIVGYMGHAIAVDSDCGCSSDGGWGSSDYGSDSSGGSSSDGDSGGGGGSGDTSSGGSTSGGSGDTSSGSSSDSSSSGGGGDSSSDSGGSSASTGGSAEEGVTWRMKADDLYKKGLYNESLSAYNTSIRYDPYTIKAWVGQGRAFSALGNPTDAAVSFGKALRLDPGNTDILILLGDAQNATGNYEDAVITYTKALAMNPNLVIVKEKIAIVEAAKTAVLTPPLNISAVNESTVVPTTEPSMVQNTTAIPENSSRANTAPFPGITIILLAVGTGFVLLTIRKE